MVPYPPKIDPVVIPIEAVPAYPELAEPVNPTINAGLSELKIPSFAFSVSRVPLRGYAELAISIRSCEIHARILPDSFKKVPEFGEYFRGEPNLRAVQRSPQPGIQFRRPG